MRRLSVSRHLTRRTISLPSMDEAGPVQVLHVGVADPLEPLFDELPNEIEYLRFEQMIHEFDEAAIEAHAGKVILMSFGRLDDRALAQVKRVGKHRLPLVVICDGEREERTLKRDTARSVGASTLILRSELSPRSLDQAILHARDVARVNFQHAELSERYALAIAGARDGLWEWDLETEVVYYSQRFCELLGLEMSDMRPTPQGWFERVHPHDLAGLHARIAEHTAGMDPVLQYEHRVRCVDGLFRWFLVRGIAKRRDDDSVTRIAGSLTDVTAFRAQAATLRAATRQDVITELPRRQVLLERLARALELSRGYGDYEFGVLLIEVNNLQQVDEGLGPQVGDMLLAGIARRLKDVVGGDDLLTTAERGQFAILRENVQDHGDGPRLAASVHEAMRSAFEINGENVFTSVNIGMTSSAQAYERVDDVLADVASAVRRARQSSNRPHEVHDTRIRIEARTLLRLEMAMHDAIERQEFELFYQPIIDFERWTLYGFEGLLRWRHPERGLVSPAEFIPIAEDTGLIVPIGRWTIRQACRQLSLWLENHEVADQFTVSVNLSARQIADPQLLPVLRESLREWRIPPGRLKLGLTESVLMNEQDESTALFNAIRKLGIQLFIDDFGTGYSSLSYLHRFPIDGLKIDRAFVQYLDGTPHSATMVRTILALAENLGVDVVAEGIETDIQAEQLLELGCNKHQGFRFSKPLPLDEAHALVNEGPAGAFRTLGGDHR